MKRCPFCNSEASFGVVGMITDSESWIRCSNEECKGFGPSSYTEEKAVEAWNNRPIENELIEALEKAKAFLTHGNIATNREVGIIYIDSVLSKAKGEVK